MPIIIAYLVSLTGVINGSAVVSVCGSENFKKGFSVLSVSKSILKLFKADAAVSVLVQCLENLL